MTPQSTGLILDKVTIGLKNQPLLTLSARIDPGEVLSVMGASGSGKSTLLAFIAGFLDPAFTGSGNAWLDGTQITAMPAHLRRVGLLFQDPLLFPHMSVGENLLFALRDAAALQRRDIVETALRDAGLDGFFDRDPATLSGGQKARAALMRMLLSKPRALLLDEPFSKLDAALRSQTRQFVFAEAKRRGLPVLLVTHDPADAAQAGGAIVELGKAVADG